MNLRCVQYVIRHTPNERSVSRKEDTWRKQATERRVGFVLENPSDSHAKGQIVSGWQKSFGKLMQFVFIV
jgi:hypothetical protein